MNSTEALVVGGGPAGAASALAMRRMGWDVTLLESMAGFSPIGWKKVCGSFLNAEAVGGLYALGMLERVVKAGGRPVTSLLVTEPSGRAARVSLVSSQGGPLCVRRSTLDRLLLEAASDRGVRVCMGAEVTNIQKQKVFHEGKSTEANIIVLADGKRCRWGRPEDRRVREALGADGWYGLNADFSDPESASSQIELHFFKEGYLGLLNFESGVTNLCGLSRQSLFRRAGGDLDALLEAAASGQPRMRRRLQRMTRLTPWRAVGPLPFGRMAPLSDERFLVGDAAAIIDPFIGGGIGMALKSGWLLGSVLKASPRMQSNLEFYAKLWKIHFGRRLRASRYFRWCLDEPWRMRMLVSFMERWPCSLESLTRSFCARAPLENLSSPLASRFEVKC
jgi:2-polyprenyl-6-methoxyphenol hydroxylase-like FAD-dependent oxidoreductase